uniref:Zinc-dependent peptidase n=1 Tax=Roseihalotalea indica TaxID=2867963 RepID=A0AA49GSK4_9BACT|nr:zinc-dependent peptidase [Tunicatimonas sp. TK19036]
MAFLFALFFILLVSVGIFYRNIPTPPPLYPLVRVQEVQAILAKYFTYYQRLPPAQQKIFLRRVIHFIQQKQFIPRGFRPVTMEMKAMISASAVQLTFGLPKVSLAHFKRILIYLDDYYSTITRQYHRGEVNPRLQAIVLSWYSLVEGYADPADARNLGLHEMAHALELENMIENEEYQFFPTDAQRKWKQLVNHYVPRIKTGEITFFRPYAATNAQEFFAVAVECFFENTTEFHRQHPDLYKVLATLLNQNPLAMVSFQAQK